MKKLTFILGAAVLAGCAPSIDPAVEAAFKANPTPWKDPQVNAINRLPARDIAVPCESEEIAFDIARGLKRRTESKWVESLNGEWDFAWKHDQKVEKWEKTGKIAVPGCWQVQGEYDPPLYTNVQYPIAKTAPDPTGEPDKSWTSFFYRNPVGLYSRTFTLPKGWGGRRTVIHFGGVSSAMYLRVNGHNVGYSEDSRLPAEFDLSPYLKGGENKLEVEVLKHCDGSFLEDQDFWRLSGIFRDVWLVSEHPDAPKDYRVETWLSDDYKLGTFKVFDEKGNLVKERKVENPRLWSAECPDIYVTPVEFTHGFWPFKKTDYRTVSFGFRKIEIKDSVVLLNGKRVLFKGADRHEMQPEAGYAVTLEGMQRDIDLMKSFNLNAVRTCHYPDAPDWYQLCDRKGLYVVCEANVETHGYNIYKGTESLSFRKEFEKAHVERGTRMIETFRNHPSIIFWSMGNESGKGPNFEAEFKAMKALDATRPIQYEGMQDSDFSEIKCPMYMRPWNCEKYVKDNPKKPFILCEYTHAMGNSNGGIQKYWDLAEKYPSFQGGFIWDFVDQALWKTDAKGKWLAYGGDFGDKPNDDNFNCNGFVDALRNPHPGAYEIKHAYQPVKVLSFDWATGVAKVRNGYCFIDLDCLDAEWVLTKDGATVASGKFDVSALGPGQTMEVKADIASADGDAILFRFTDLDNLVAWDQFAKPFAPVQAGPAGTPAPELAAKLKLNFWRAPTDNDRGWKMPTVCKVWKDATSSQQLPKGVKSDLKVTKRADGTALVDWTLVVPKGLPPIPRVGLTFTVPTSVDKAEWYGLGPWENYSDRATGAILGTYAATITLATGLADESGTIAYAKDALNPDNYIEPGEQGYRTGCRRLKLGDVEVTAVNAPFGFNAWPYPQTMLEGKKHVWEMSKGDAVTVNVDAVQMGVGGDDSWGNRPHDEFMPGAGTYRLVFTVKGL